jgi:hypothetical protein
MKFFRNVSLLFSAMFLVGSSQCLAGAEGKGGGDGVVCGAKSTWAGLRGGRAVDNDGPFAAEYFETPHLYYDPSEWLEPVGEDRLLDIILDYVQRENPTIGSDLKSIRGQLTFSIVERFSQSIPNTGYHVKANEFLVSGCHRVFIAKQNFTQKTVELLRKYYIGDTWVSDINPPQYAGGLNEYNKAILKFHDIMLNRNQRLHSDSPLIDIEDMTRRDVMTYMNQDTFFAYVISKAIISIGLEKSYLTAPRTATVFDHFKGFKYRQVELQRTGLCTVHPTNNEIQGFWDLNGESSFVKDEPLCAIKLIN